MTPLEILQLAITIIAGVLALLTWVQHVISQARLRHALGVVSWDAVLAMQIFIGVLSTLGYLAMLGFCLWNSYNPVYADLFNKLLQWSIVPGLIWGFFFGRSL